jgi:hypothetical protein
MFDHLLFVEGPSDESVLRELGATLGSEVMRGSVGFVHMGGTRNFAYYAADHILDFLARRRVRLWFLVDRDEADDEEVVRMTARLGARASLKVLERRELENYLLDPAALRAFVSEKREAAGLPVAGAPDEAAVAATLNEVAVGLRDEVVRLQLGKRLLSSIHLGSRRMVGTPNERIEQAITDLQERLRTLEPTRQAIEGEMAVGWPESALALVPGSLILDRLAQRFEIRFNKNAGDRARLAHLIKANAVPEEIEEFLNRIAASLGT